MTDLTFLGKMGNHLEWLDIVAAAIATCCLMWFGFLIRRGSFRGRALKPLPPGPRGWPVLGSLLSMGTEPHKTFHKLSKRYGPVMFMHLGSRPTVVLSSPETARDILKTYDHVLASRPQTNISVKIFSYNHTDIFFAPYGQEWRHMRTICTQELLTTSRIQSFQGMRQRMVMTLIDTILDRAKEEATVNLRELLAIMSINNILQMMMNEGSFSAEKVTAFYQVLKEVSFLAGTFHIGQYIPSLSGLDLQKYNKRTADVFEKMDNSMETMVEERRKKLSTSEAKKTVPDFLDVLLAIPKTDKSDSDVTNNKIKALFQDMLLGGSDTTSILLEWTLSELLRNPMVMKALQEELDSVIGPQRLVEESDLPQLKYLQAVVKEALRLHPSAPLYLRAFPKDGEIGGFHIPGGVQIVINMWGIQRDPNLWERPLEFDPNRFLNSSVDYKGQDFSYLPFSAGRRICPGMNLAMVFVQFALAQLIHNINFTLPPDQNPEDLDMSEVFGLTLPKAIPLTVAAKPRRASHAGGALAA